MYLNAIFNHFRALQAWAAAREAHLTLDLKTFELEVKYRGRYYPMVPTFQGRVDGREVHSVTMPENLVGFGGWRPYRMVVHPLSTEKRKFKEHLDRVGLATPPSLMDPDPMASIPFDFLLKANAGSFGRQILGPFRAGLSVESVARQANRPGDEAFVEAFIPGTILKIWFWGAKPFFAHSHGYPTIRGDGESAVDDLLRRKLRACGLDWDGCDERDVVAGCLRFQGVDRSAVLPRGTEAWIDYRYAQRYEPSKGRQPSTDNALAALTSRTGSQVPEMGRAVAQVLKDAFPAPILITVDGVLDRDDRIRWLEMNVNSLMPPEGYAVMFDDLFA